MLLSFSVENFRSFKNRQVLFLTAAKTCKEWQVENVIEAAGQRVLRTAVIYGANASGKTNLFIAMERMRLFMLASLDMDKAASFLFVEPFLLSKESFSKPETFEIQLLIDGSIFTYGFSLRMIGNQLDKYVVDREWLVENVKNRERVYFLRESKKAENGDMSNLISVNKKRMPLGSGLEARTRPDVLFFTVAAQFAEPTCQKISEYIRNSFNVVSGLNHATMNAYTKSRFQMDPETGERIKKLINEADTGIKDLKVSADGQLLSLHDIYDADDNAVGKTALNFTVSESLGTQKLFDLSGGMIDTLRNGRVMIVDEFDAKMHPLLVRRLVMLFNNPETNPNNAQLIINVQSPDLLAYKAFYAPRKRAIARLRRDQFFFVEKDNAESSRVFSLIEYKGEKGVRNDASFAKDYLLGAYGGIPYLEEMFKIGD